jgi:RNA polymerase sigma-70 factor, ECF subfamily
LSGDLIAGEDEAIMTSSSARDESDEGVEAAIGAFNESRPRLFGIAYRMLGSVAEAEDIVQEAWVRWQRTDRTVVRNPAGFLTTVTTRLALNTAESARARREQYVGPWLPEPVDTSADPSLGAEKAEALESAVLVLLEKVRPDQRAAYVLREAFDYSYDEVADILDTSAANARQLVSRAKKSVQSDRKEPVEPARHRSLLEAFLAAARDGDVKRLEQVLSAEVVSTTDSAGQAPRAARRPVIGRDNVARFIAGWSDWWEGTTLSWVETNGQTSVLARRDGAPAVLLSASTSDSGIDQLMWVMAPDKLTHVPA